MKKRMLSFALALLTVLSTLPFTLLPSVASVSESVQASGADATVVEDGAKNIDKYAALYVQDNLIFRWDAFDSLADSASAKTLTLTDRDGRTGSITLAGATAQNGYVSSKSNLDYTSLVPKNGADYTDFSFDASIIQLGTTLTWPTLSLGTLDLTSGTGSTIYNDTYGNFHGTYKQYIKNDTTSVTYYFDQDGNLLSAKPASGEYKEVTVPYLALTKGQYGTDHATWPRFYGNYKNQSYSIGATVNYTVTDGYGSFDLTTYRDMQKVTSYTGISYARGYTSSFKDIVYTSITPAATADQTAYEAALAMAAKNPAANGTYAGTKTDPAVFAFGGSQKAEVGYYSFRLYSDILTADEYQQNHFADLCAYHKIDNVAQFLSLSDGSKKALYQTFADADITKAVEEIHNTSYEDVTKEELDLAILDAYVAEKGLFDRTYVTFDGYQVSQFTGVGLRAVFTLSKTALAELPEGMSLAELGILRADKDALAMHELTVTEENDGNFAAPAGVTVSTVQKAGVNQSGVISENAEALVFADAILFEDVTLDQTVFDEYIFRAYAVFESGDSNVVVYTDGVGENEALVDGASLYELTAVLCTKDVSYASYQENKKVLTSVMKQIDRLQNTFRDSAQTIDAWGEAVVGKGTAFENKVSNAETLLITVKEARNKALTETNATIRANYLTTATSALTTVNGYVTDLANIKKNDARTAADHMLERLALMKADYANLRTFAEVTKVEGLEPFFAEAEESIENASELCRTLIPRVKNAYDRMCAIKTVLGDFKKEIEGTQGDGKGTTQVFLFAASTTTDNYPASTQFPWQGFGYEFDEYFDDTVSVVNPSVAGWGLKTLTGSYKQNNKNLEELFAPENSVWAKMLMRLNPGDYVFFGSTGANEKWQTGGNVYYVENADGTYSIVEEDTPGAKYYSVMQSPEDYQKMLIECAKILIDRGVTPIFCTSFGNLGISSNANLKDTSCFTSGTKDHENIKFAVVDELNAYYRAKNGDNKTYAYLSDAAERCREVFLSDMQNGMTFDQLLDTYNRTQGAIEAFYETYGYVGTNLTKYLTTNEKFEADRVHQNIHGALLISSQTLKDLRGSGLPLLDHVVTYELDEVEVVCNTLKAAGVSYIDPRKK